MHVVKLRCVELTWRWLSLWIPLQLRLRECLCVTRVVWDPDSTPGAGTSKPLKSESGGHCWVGSCQITKYSLQPRATENTQWAFFCIVQWQTRQCGGSARSTTFHNIAMKFEQKFFLLQSIANMLNTVKHCVVKNYLFFDVFISPVWADSWRSFLVCTVLYSCYAWSSCLLLV